eukprot:CAMPEP_0206258568 /NCGR_PEP_ID=MMETSP0047_2-20121206/25996_1 /ASSEMBLY_ACC=CAM_ASM_000192 /TAXON_ID=195065 /ORGANISM="Chroomonas mesostigmatica_cf, Strain CCMP1168" /LENGTH=33 /DNA_ID= /DNA_START= /DNA_END= /DNA_ORIENTATION=
MPKAPWPTAPWPRCTAPKGMRETRACEMHTMQF